MKNKKYHEQWFGYFIIVNSGKSLLLVFSVIIIMFALINHQLIFLKTFFLIVLISLFENTLNNINHKKHQSNEFFFS